MPEHLPYNSAEKFHAVSRRFAKLVCVLAEELHADEDQIAAGVSKFFVAHRRQYAETGVEPRFVAVTDLLS